MPLDATSIAAVVGSTVENVTFQPGANNVPRKNLIIGTYDPAKSLVVDEVPIQVLSAEDAGHQTGFGFPIHRLVKKAFLGNSGIPTYIVPQAEVAGSQAAGSITVTGPATEAGSIHLYIAGDYVRVPVANGDTDAVIATSIETAITAKEDLPITGVAALGVVTTTAKDTSTYGNGVVMTLNEGLKQALPLGVAIVFVQQAGGAGVPDIADALAGLGTGDASNEDNYTGLVHSYGQDTGTLDALSLYNGVGNEFVGLYTKTIGRPFRVLDGDTADGSAGLAAVIAIGDGRRELDRTNGIICVPGSPNHPSEIAAIAMGTMEKTNNNVAAESFIGKPLPTIIPGLNNADRWTNEFNNINTALLSGISSTIVKNNTVIMQNVATFYHPAGVSFESNAYRSQRNISILQNILFNDRLNFEAPDWQGIIIVADVTKVTNAIDRQKARDRGAVIDDLLVLAEAYEGHAWLYSASFTIEKLQSDPSLVALRPGGTGFNIFLPLVLSAEGGIFDVIAQVDASLAVFTS